MSLTNLSIAHPDSVIWSFELARAPRTAPRQTLHCLRYAVGVFSAFVVAMGVCAQESEVLVQDSGAQSGIVAIGVGTGQGNSAKGSVGGVVSALPDAFSGALTTAIPLRLPPGTKSPIPQLSLTYNSRRGNGAIGVGWQLELPYITTAPSRGAGASSVQYIFQSGNGPIELIRKNGDEYQARVERTFLRFLRHATPDGKIFWEVATRQGVRLFLGRADESRLTLAGESEPRAWFVSDATDPFNNRMLVSYSRESHEELPLPKSIIFDNPSLSTLLPRSLAFDYEKRPDTVGVAMPGADVTLSRRLAAIRTLVGAATYDTLSLSYQERPFSVSGAAASLLSEVSVTTAVPGATPQRIASLRYGASVSGIETAELNTQPFAFGSIAEQCLFGNFSGTGRTDMICRQQGRWEKVDIATTDIAISALDETAALDPSLKLKEQCLSGEFEGIGQSSIACYVKSKAAWVVMHLASKTEFTSTVWAGPEPTGQCLVLDLNADGRSDLACQSSDPKAMGHWSVSLSTGKSWVTTSWGSGPAGGKHILPGPFPELFFPHAQAYCLAGDFNSDRRGDIACYRGDLSKWDVALSTGAAWSLQKWDGPKPDDTSDPMKKCMALDFDGNGRADIACASGSTDWTIALSFPAGPRKAVWSNGPTSNFVENCLVGDLNGDGKVDFACNTTKDAKWTFALNTGAGWLLQNLDWVDLVGRETRSTCFSRESGFQKTEMLCSRTDGVYERLRSTGTYPHLLRSIVGTLGGRTEIEYGSSADTQAARMPAAPVVTLVRNDNGTGLSVSTTLTYSHGLFNPLDQTFRGFREVTLRTTGHPQVEDSITRREFYQGATTADGKDAPWAGVPYLRGRERLREVLDSKNQPISRQVFAYRLASSAPYFSPLEMVTTYTCLPDCLPVQTDVFEVDSNGGVTTEVRKYFGPWAPASRRIERTFQASVDGSLMGFPASEKVLSVDGSRTLSEARFFYDKADDCSGNAGEAEPRLGLVTRIERMSEDGSTAKTEFGYDALGNPTCVRNSRGYVTRFNVDPATNFLTSKRNALGQTTRYSYFGTAPTQVGWFGQLHKVEGPDGIVVRTEYDALRRPSTAYVNEQLSPFRKTVYSNIGDTAKQTITEFDALGLPRAMRFDGGGNTVETVVAMTPTAGVRSSELWLPGRTRIAKSMASFVSEPAGVATRFTYEAAGRISRIDHPSGRTSRICYLGLAEFEIDGAEIKRAIVRAASGEVVEYVAFAGATAADCEAVRKLVAPDLSIIPDNHIIGRRALQRDELGRIVQVRDSGRIMLSRSYDQLGRLRAEFDADRGGTTYQYDEAGNLILRRDATGRTVATRYDALDRPIAVDIGLDDSLQKISLRYDDRGPRSVGKLTAIESPGTIETLDYDDEGRPSVVSTNNAGVVLTLTKTFDAIGRIASIRYPDGMEVKYGYDGHFLKTVNVDGKPFASFDHPTPFGQYQRAELSNGLVREVSYSGPGNMTCQLPGYLPCTDTLKAPNGSLISAQLLKFDDRTRLIQVDDDRPGFSRVSNRFYYDGADRLAAHATKSLESSWTGEALPAIDLLKLPAGKVPDAFGAAEPGAGWRSLLAYDSSGNVSWSLQSGRRHYPSLNAPRPNALQSMQGMSFEYDDAGRAIKAMGALLKYDVAGRVTEVQQGASKSSFSFGGSGELRQYQVPDQPSRQVIGQLVDCKGPAKCRNAIVAAGEVIGFVDEGVTVFTHRDHLGSVREVTDKNGKVGARISYAAFGNTVQSAGGPFIKYRSFAGGQSLEGTELYRMGPRIYFPRVERFLSPDPIVNIEALPFAANPYVYAFNRPTYYADPDGYFPWAIVAAAAFIGGVQAAQHGDNVFEGALRGAVFGVFIAGGYAVIGSSSIGVIGQGAVIASSGAMGGVAQAAIWGGDPGQAAQGGAISALGSFLLGGMEINAFGNADGLAGTANYVTTSALKGAAMSATYAVATGRDPRESAIEGAKSGAIGALAASAAHHVGAFAATGNGPKWDAGRRVYVYNTSNNWLKSDWPGFSLGNVVSTDDPNVVISSMPGKNTLDHEASHTWKQSTALGPGWGYLGSHAVAMLASLVYSQSTHDANVLEMQGGWIDVPND